MRNRLKILYIHHGSGSGGAPNALIHLLQALDADRFEVIVACGYTEPNAKSFFEANGIHPVDIPAARFAHGASWLPLYTPRGMAKTLEWMLIKQPRSAVALNKVLSAEKPDIVHLNSLTIAPLAPIIKRSGIAVVLHVREPVATGSVGLRRAWLIHLIKQYVDHTIYICQDNQDRLAGPTTNSSVIYDPISLDKFDYRIDGSASRRKLGILPKAKVLFFPGGSSLGIKGIFPFLDALAIVIRQHPDVTAIVPGIDSHRRPYNPERRRIESAIKRLQLNDHIIRLPFTSSVETYYAASDIVLAPFVRPHASLAVLEAGAMKKPVIGSKIGGIEEVLQDRQTGLLCQPGNANNLALLIFELLNNTDSAKQLGRTGYSYIKEKFDLLTHVRSVTAIYNTLLATK